MRRFRTLYLLLVGVLLLTSCSDAARIDPTPEPDRTGPTEVGEVTRATATVTEEDGGSVAIPGLIAVDISPGSVDEDTTLIVEGGHGAAPVMLLDDESDAGIPFFNISLESGELTGPAEIAFTWQGDEYDVTRPENSFVVHLDEESDEWEPIESTYDPERDMVIAETADFSWFGFVSPRDVFNNVRNLLTLNLVRLLDSTGVPCPDQDEFNAEIDDSAGGLVIGACVLSEDASGSETRIQFKNLSLYEYQFISDPAGAGVDYVADPNGSDSQTINLSSGDPVQVVVEETDQTQLRFAVDLVFSLAPIPGASTLAASGLVDHYRECASQQLIDLTTRHTRVLMESESVSDFFSGAGGLWGIDGQANTVFCMADRLETELSGPFGWEKMGLRLLTGLAEDVIKLAAGVLGGTVLDALTFGSEFLIARFNDMAATLQGHGPYIEIVNTAAAPSLTPVPTPQPTAAPEPDTSNPPSPPSGVQFGAFSDSVYGTLEWTDQSGNESAFALYYNISARGWTHLRNVPANTEQYTIDESVTMNGMSFADAFPDVCLGVAAVNDAGQSDIASVCMLGRLPLPDEVSCPINDDVFCRDVEEIAHAIEHENFGVFIEYLGTREMPCSDEFPLPPGCAGQPEGTPVHCVQSGLYFSEVRCVDYEIYETDSWSRFSVVTEVAYPGRRQTQGGPQSPVIFVHTPFAETDYAALYLRYIPGEFEGWEISATLFSSEHIDPAEHGVNYGPTYSWPWGSN